MDYSRLFIISGPSGSGQDAVIEGLQGHFPIERVITSTTRPMRSSEAEGLPYHFIDRDAFIRRIDEHSFVEWAKEYNDEYYGVEFSELERVVATGRIAIWKMEWQGVITAKKLFPGIKAILVFAQPEILEARLKRRDNPSEEYLRERMRFTQEFLSHRNIYDFEVENKENCLDKTVDKVASFIRNCSPAS